MERIAGARVPGQALRKRSGQDTQGALTRLWGNLRKSLKQQAYGWFQRWSDVEAQA